MEQCQQALLNRIAEAQFCCIELQLYLDTHPEDAIATADYNCYAERLDDLMTTYHNEYGPLMNFGVCPYVAGSWVDQKWPWQQ